MIDISRNIIEFSNYITSLIDNKRKEKMMMIKNKFINIKYKCARPNTI